MIWVYAFISLVIVQRLVEVGLANQNAKWIRSKGGYEVGQTHYKYLVLLHGFFFVSLITEVTIKGVAFDLWSAIPFAWFLFAQILRLWALSSLGRFWNTRIMILPDANVIASGPYRYIKHPNYAVVIIEIAMLPLFFKAYMTAFLFSLLNAIVLYIRIHTEEEALQAATNYEAVFEGKARFTPKLDE
ncbi:isoprenylcysteine carboxyl methyltransferase family protein [Halalkalibacterium halodurans]|uniref:isoprenylcysteine carboxyl methyltransferase family protein n=1 Tax=Halalkalibacterium halodurans TaxID=86665 RepID=UPI0010685BFA|nr:isoprenylcysteine carboxyl methyltransferase family protein [Halalkalibacterium halodurans]MED3647592.1 isoprenylcysteine carboxyl methyltransferase family protein [Halalkalibacterium halodurans]TES52176.1 isoprenylcysteine carboxyl methyltransferase [Halalkalibacterium halodurans]